MTKYFLVVNNDIYSFSNVYAVVKKFKSFEYNEKIINLYLNRNDKRLLRMKYDGIRKNFTIFYSTIDSKIIKPEIQPFINKIVNHNKTMDILNAT